MASIGNAKADIVLDLVYDVDQGSGRWETVTKILADSVGADSAVLFRLPNGSAPPEFFGHSVPQEAAAVQSYVDHFHTVDEFADFTERFVPASLSPITAHKNLGRRCLSNSEWYADFILPMGYAYVGGVLLSDPSANQGRIAFTYLRSKSSGDFEDNESDLVTCVGRHIVRAITLDATLRQHRLGEVELVQAFDIFSFGIVLLDQAGYVMEMNAFARQIVRRGDCMRLSARRLSCIDRSLAPYLEHAITSAGRATLPPEIGFVRLPRLDPAGHYQVAVVPTRTATRDINYGRFTTAVLIFDAGYEGLEASNWIRELYGLSPAEADLASSLLSGLSLNEHASLRGLSKNTVRWTLKQVFMKTEASSQADLVKLMVQGPIGSLAR